MKLLIKAIRTELTGDATLIAEVPAADITTSFNAENANFPCIVLGIANSSNIVGISGLSTAILKIEIYTSVSKQKAWEDYSLVRGLLHNQEQNISTSDRKIHLIIEKTAYADEFDFRTNTWRLTAEYDIYYGTSSVVTTTAADGAIYADASDVTAVSGKEIAKFKGKVTLDIQFDGTIRSEQERFGKSIYYGSGTAIIQIEEVIFKPVSLQLLWGITYNASDTLADDSTIATSYLVTQATTPSILEFLFQMTRTDDAKKLEIEADKTMVPDLRIPFSKKDLTIHDCRFICVGDASDNVVKISVQN